MLRPQAECATIYLYRKPVDMRKAINGLVAIVEGQMSLDPFSSGLFVFCNNNRSIVKCVYCLARDLKLDDINGQIIIIPGLNAPALCNSSRVSPLDAGNLNRAFPGNPLGNITEQLAYYVETVLLPMADAAVDLHSGGKASFFEPCALATRTEDKKLYASNLELATAFGLPLIWVLGSFNDKRSLNSAAARAGVPMIATELGGGGGAEPQITDAADWFYKIGSVRLHHYGYPL